MAAELIDHFLLQDWWPYEEIQTRALLHDIRRDARTPVEEMRAELDLILECWGKQAIDWRRNSPPRRGGAYVIVG